MSNNKDTVGSLEYTYMKNADYRSSAEHYGHCIYICKTQNKELRTPFLSLLDKLYKER